MRRTEVRPIWRRLAISDLLMPTRCSFRISAACRAAVFGRPKCFHSVGPAPNQPECARAKSRAQTPRRWRACRPWRARLVWSDPAPRSRRRSRRRDDAVPEVWPVDRSPIGPSDPASTPARRRFPASALLPAISLVPPASPHRSRSHALAERSSNHGGRHSRAWLGSASRGSADQSSKRGRTAPPGTFWSAFVPGQKRVRLRFLRGRFMGIARALFCLAAVDPFRPSRTYPTTPPRGWPDVSVSRGNSRASIPTVSISTRRRAGAVRSDSGRD